MSDYEQELVFTIKLQPNTFTYFYEDVLEHSINKPIRGAFLVTNNDDYESNIVMEVHSDKSLIYKTEASQDVFFFEVDKPMTLKIRLVNPTNKEVSLTFTINSNHNQLAEKEHLSFSEDKLNQISSFLNRLTAERRFLISNMIDKNSKLEHIAMKFSVSSIIETVLLVVISVIQFYYIKKLFEVKTPF
jgi:hypothetical protein